MSCPVILAAKNRVFAQLLRPDRYLNFDEAVQGKIRVEIRGLKNISQEAVAAECTRELSGVVTTGDLVQAASKLSDTLLSSACFDHVAVSLDHQEEPNAGDDGTAAAAASTVIVRVDAAERQKSLQLGTAMTRSCKGALELTAQLPGLGGRLLAGSLEASGTLGGSYEATGKLQGLGLFPLFGRLHNVNAMISKKQMDFTDTSGHREDSLAGQLSCVADSQNFMAVEFAERETIPSPNAPLSVLRSPLRSLVASLSWNLGLPFRSSRTGVFGNYSHVIRASAGLPAPLIQLQNCGELYKDWGDRLGFALRAAGGAVLGADGDKIPMQDRFFLGGSMGASKLVPGFRHRAMGPAATLLVPGSGPRCFWTGGKFYTHGHVEAGVSFKRREAGEPLLNRARATIFANVTNLSSDSADWNSLHSMVNSASIYAGLGCIIPTGDSRPEIQLVIGKHLRLNPGDGAAPLQFGLRVAKTWL